MRQPLAVSADQLEDIARKKEQQEAPQAVSPSKPAVQSVSVVTDGGAWKAPSFPDEVDVLQAKATAFEHARQFMDDILQEDDMTVELEAREVDVPLGRVVNLKTGDVVNTYEGMDLLKVYAQNYKHRGLIVDGNV